MDDAARERWAGPNGGVGHTVFVDGFMAGLWRRHRDGQIDLELFRGLTRAEAADLDAEVARTETFLDPPRREFSAS